MLERYCDALIIGTDLSGLITGAFLARRGLTVHILDLDPFARNAKEPDPFCVAHLHSKLFRSILGRLNIPESDIQALSGSDSPLQIIFPNKRIDISANPVTFFDELEREFPDQHQNLKLFYEKLANIKHQVETQQLYSLLLPTSFKEKRQLMKFVKEHQLDNRLKGLGIDVENNSTLHNFLMAQLKLVTYTHTNSPFAFQVAELLNPSEGEIFSVQGGHHYLKRLFIERVQHHEGAYRPEAKIEKLLYRDGIFEGAALAGMEGNVLARYVIWNTDLKRLNQFLPNLWRFRKLRKSIHNIKPSAHWFTAHYELPKEFIPEPMKDNLVVISNPEKELKGSNFLYVQIKPKEENKVLISVSYLWGPESLEADEETFLNLHEQIRIIIGKLFPFGENHLTYQFPLKEVSSDTNTLFPLEENDFEIFKQSAKEHTIYSLAPKSFSDLFPIGYKTAAPNLFITSPEILGSLGYEGKFMLGLKVTDLIWEDVKKEKKWAMKTERRIA